jgi:hypothetical protein
MGKVSIVILAARTGLPAVGINNTAASIMPSRIIESSYCRRSLKTVPTMRPSVTLRDAARLR